MARWIRSARLVARSRKESGAVSVEAALVTPLLVLLVFGIIEFGMYYKDAIVISSMSRTGVRTISAEPRLASQFTDTVNAITTAVGSASAGSVKELWIYDAGTNGFPKGQSGFTTCTNCLRYTWNGTTFTPVAGYTWDPLLQNACPADPLHTSVGVYVKADHKFVTGLFPGTLSTSDHSVMRLEPVPVTAGCK